MERLSADFSAALQRDLKKKAARRGWDLSRLEEVVDSAPRRNTPESIQTLKRRHDMHPLSGEWAGRRECHIANAGDWPVIWSCNDETAFFERTGSHKELSR
ncbi:type II toxin-antitoxin system RelE/ParE family toxin [Olsenella uli]